MQNIYKRQYYMIAQKIYYLVIFNLFQIATLVCRPTPRASTLQIKSNNGIFSAFVKQSHKVRLP